ncbi:MAG: tyrosine-type recombinase/integrase [Dehalococcoidia bacterium]
MTLRTGNPAFDAQLVESFETALRAGWQKARSDQTIRTYCFALKYYLSHAERRRLPPLTEITPTHVQGYVIVLRGERSASTAQLYLLALKTMLDWLVDEDEREDNPADRLRLPARTQASPAQYTPDEIRHIFRSQDPKTVLGARNLALFSVLLDTGIRRGEAVNARLSNYDPRTGYLRVIGKGNKERLVRLGHEARRAVDTYLRRRARAGITSDYLFTSLSGRPLGGHALGQLHRALGKELGIAMHPHRWRHTFAQHCLDEHMDREYVRMLMGHTDLRTLTIYTKQTDQGRALRAHETYSPLDAMKRGGRRRP